MNIDRAGDLFELVGNLCGLCKVTLDILTDDLDIDGRRQPEIEDLADHVRRLEKELRSRKFMRQIKAKLALIICRGTMIRLERNHDVRIRGADGSRIGIGQVDAAVRKANVVENAV